MADTMKDEIQALKNEWENDPCWDIETTEGFEDYREELLAYRLKCEAKWDAEYQEELKAYAAEIGIPENLPLAKHIRFLEERIDQLETENELRGM